MISAEKFYGTDKAKRQRVLDLTVAAAFLTRAKKKAPADVTVKLNYTSSRAEHRDARHWVCSDSSRELRYDARREGAVAMHDDATSMRWRAVQVAAVLCEHAPLTVRAWARFASRCADRTRNTMHVYRA